MQADLLAEDPQSPVRLFAVNPATFEGGNAFVTGAIPLLQEAGAAGPWKTWRPTYRDVVVLDRQNRKLAVFNLTEHDLRQQTEYDALRAILAAAAGGAE
ncbi:MAG: hypothetical protein HMLKMBBP_03040 [Planctomycetes bacterium]|nr:hypothetical protein [Planctomycetota bacterium]